MECTQVSDGKPVGGQCPRILPYLAQFSCVSLYSSVVCFVPVFSFVSPVAVASAVRYPGPCHLAPHPSIACDFEHRNVVSHYVSREDENCQVARGDSQGWICKPWSQGGRL